MINTRHKLYIYIYIKLLNLYSLINDEHRVPWAFMAITLAKKGPKQVFKMYRTIEDYTQIMK